MGCRSTLAVGAAAWTWGRRPCGSPASASASWHWGAPSADRGDLATPIPETQTERDPKKKYIREIARVCQKLYQQVYQSLEEGALPIVLGGDHSLAAGSVGASADFAAARGGEIGLLWIDAHGDMNTPATTTSGNVHGMPLAALVGPEPAELSKIGVRSPKVRADKTVLIGIRNLDDLEKEQIRDAKVHLFTMKDIDQHGIAVVMKRALAIAGKDTAGIHVSFDLDVCDPAIAPGVGTPVKGGLDYREAHMRDGDDRRLRPADGARSRRDQSDPRLAESDGDSGHGAGAVGARDANHLSA